MPEFDPNFCFSVPSTLENARLKLVPWNPSTHSTIFVEQISPHPELFDWLPFGPFNSRGAFDPWFYSRIQSRKSEIAFAIYDKTHGKEGSAGFAGMIGLLNASEANLSVEIGFLVILPAFQRTHVSSNAVGLVLQYCLDIPSTTPDNSGNASIGLGLRRVYWSANTLNIRSITLAERVGLKLEGILRWDRILPADRVQFGKQKTLREGDPRADQPGRDTARLAICWDDWMEGGAEKVQRVMQRVS